MKNLRVQRVISVFLLSVLLIVGVCGCGSKEQGPSGTYTPGDGLVYLIFDDDNATIKMGSMSATGTWEIKDGEVTITYNIGESGTDEKVYTYDSANDTLTASNGEVSYHTED